MNWLIGIWVFIVSLTPWSATPVVQQVSSQVAPVHAEAVVEAVSEALAKPELKAVLEAPTVSDEVYVPPKQVIVPVYIQVPVQNYPQEPENPIVQGPSEGLELEQEPETPMPAFKKEPTFALLEGQSVFDVSWEASTTAKTRFYLLDSWGQDGVLQFEASGTEFQIEVNKYARPIFYRVELEGQDGQIIKIEKQLPQK